MRRSFPRDIGELSSIFSFVREYLDGTGVPISDPFAVDLVLEELFTNMVKYSAGGRSAIEIELARADDRIRISLRERDVEPYDITKAREVDVNAPLAERRIGGLGLHFVRQVCDEISYSHQDGVSTTSLVMPLDAEDASGPVSPGGSSVLDDRSRPPQGAGDEGKAGS